jgi:hypothetical protein
MYEIPPETIINKHKEDKKATKKRKRLAAAMAAARDNNGVFKVGTLIRKLFDDGLEYEGVVSAYFEEESLYKIDYDDGDTEDFDEEQMEEYFCEKQKKRKKKKRFVVTDVADVAQDV